ncbi:MAG: isoprenylcysteine carboxylmethyltransferase family protein [Pseudomonadota bacterium]
MESIRMGMAVFLVLVLPIVAVFWLIIHGFAPFWKTQAPRNAYFAAFAGILVVLLIAAPNVRALIGADLGFHIALFLAGAVIYVASIIPYRAIHRELDFRTFSGLAEITDTQNALIDTGPFAVVRHPRYLAVLIGVVGWALATNYAGAYIVSLLFTFVLIVITKMEERELLKRYGGAYEDYRRRVPMLIPRLPSREARQ